MRENLTLESLMREAGCERYPKRWEALFGQVMDEYDRNGCFLTRWQFYEDLNERYGCFEEYGYVYREAVTRTAKDEILERFLMLLSGALKDQDHKMKDLQEFTRPKTPPGKDPVA